MKKLIAAVALAFALPLTAYADQWVNGYLRSDGTYVQGHFRSSPDQWKFDNYSSSGNINPYTGRRGYRRNELTTPPALNDGGLFGGGHRRSSGLFGR